MFTPRAQIPGGSGGGGGGAVDSVNGQTGVVVLDTGDISESGNLYFTDERAQDAVGGILDDGGDIDFTYDDATPKITAAVKNGLPATRIANGSVTDAEFQYIGGLTSDAQTQIDGKQASNAGLTQIAGLADPNADRVLFWDDSAGAYTFLTMGTGLTITGTTLNGSSSGPTLGLVSAINMGYGGTFMQ